MDAFDGESDLSDVSAPPTPGAAATPRAASPGPSSPAPANDASPAPPKDASPPPSTSTRRSTRRASGPASAETTPAKELPARKASKAGGSKGKAAAPTDTPPSSRRASVRGKQLSRSPSAEASAGVAPALARRASTRGKPQSRSPSADAPTASAQSKSLKVKLTKPKSRDATPHEESATSTPASSGKKVTLKANGKKRSVADLRELGDESDDEEAAQSGDDFVPEQGPVDKKYGKRDRQTRNKARATIADDEEEEEPVKVPQRKRAKLEDSKPDDGGKRKARSGKGARRTVDYSSDEDEAMVDAASDEDDDLPNAAATGTDDEFEEDVGPAAGKKRKSDSGKKAAPRAGPSAKSTAGPGGKKAATSASAATASTAGANKAMSSEARMRASIDAALDKKAPSAAPTKLNPQASAFRPGGALKPGAPAGGASTPTGAGKPTSTTSTVKRPSGKPAFGKSMSGWDSLFGPLSGLSSPTASGSAKPTPPKAAPPVSATGIRPDPVLEAASAADVQRLKGEAVEEHLNTDECFDLLAHADIMLAFERGLYVEDRKLASRLRPFVWRAGGVIHGKQT
ncbi:hypothetical protein PSEUBRA_000754 [Kalmanozyma brasiliensis GHG001]|uniref:uncharacterized protein n=1 Tax=Kalmanozyma brasiliensis (strain GHG001) TaxID=1365824 RepID=UPI002868169D|nr:uncharacterized protein PSEUBRA_000754 [Kalmanozyma brasiliensis GHG001]KAF6766842.1 hypothetical protein PSEUBRA_000754 [Kalmanozyma brasiliensis GHG001]